MNWDPDDQLIHSSTEEGRDEATPAELWNDPGVPDAPTSFEEPASYVEPPVDDIEPVDDTAGPDDIETVDDTAGPDDIETVDDMPIEASSVETPPPVADVWAVPDDWGGAWDIEEPTPEGNGPGESSFDPDDLFTETETETAPVSPSGLPTIGADLDTEMPYLSTPASEVPMAAARVDPAFNPPETPPSGRKVNALQVVLGLLLAGAVAYTVVTWLSDSSPDPVDQITADSVAPTTAAPTTDAPTTAAPTTVLDAAAATFTSSPVGDGWTQVRSLDGGVALQLPSPPEVQTAAGTGGLVSLTTNLPSGGTAELIWSPIQPGLPPQLTSFLAATTAIDRYPQLNIGPTQTLGGLRYADGSGTTGTEQLRARVTMTDRFAFVVLTVRPPDVDPAASGTEWFRILDSLEISG